MSISRELTKLHEETVRGTLGSIEIGEPRGEYVIVLGGLSVESAPVSDDDVRIALQDSIAAGASKRDAAAQVAAATGRRRRDVYQLAVEPDARTPD